MGSHRGRLPAAPLHPDGGAGRAVRHRVRRRGRARRDRYLRCGRATGSRCLGAARGRCRAGPGPTAARYLCPRLGGDAPSRRGRPPPRRPLPHAGRGRSHVAPRRTARIAKMVTPSDAHRALAATLGHRATLLGPLGPLTTYGVGGPAAVLIEVEGPADLDVVRAALRGWDLPLFVLGRGSNLLVADAGFDGVVVQLGSGFAGLDLPRATAGAASRTSERPVVRAGAALALPVLARRVADAGWSGLSWAVGVPGSVGGAVRMNAGGHGADMASCLVRYSWVDLCSDDGGTDDVAHLDYGYRSSAVAACQVVLAAELSVT